MALTKSSIVLNLIEGAEQTAEQSTNVLQELVKFRMRTWIKSHFKERSKEVVQQLFKVVHNAIESVDVTK